MYVEVRVLRDLEFNVELRVASGRGVELDAGIMAANLEIHLRIFHMALAARLDRVYQGDLVGLTAHDAQIAYAQAEMQHNPSGKVTNARLSFCVHPTARRGT